MNQQQTMADVPTILTVKQVAAYMRVEPATVCQWVRKGQLAALRPGGKNIRIQRHALEAFIATAASTSSPSDKRRTTHSAKLLRPGEQP
jgi:excisionase family DNA binding protein